MSLNGAGAGMTRKDEVFPDTSVGVQQTHPLKACFHREIEDWPVRLLLGNKPRLLRSVS